MKIVKIKAALTTAILGLVAPLSIAVPVSANAGGSSTPVVQWTGASSDNLNDSGNWYTNSVPVAGEQLVFPTGVDFPFENLTSKTLNNDLANLAFHSLQFTGSVDISSKQYIITGNEISLTSGIGSIVGGNGGDTVVGTDVTLLDDQTFYTAFSSSLQVGVDGKTIDLGDNVLSLDARGGSISLVGEIAGTGSIKTSGEEGNVYIFATPSASSSVGLEAAVGVMQVNSATTLPVTVSGGTLKGTGTVGNVSMSSGTIAPGASPGVLNTGSLAYTGGAFDVELGGTGAGEFDQTNVVGSVDLGTATALNISLFGGYEPAINDAFVIINNDGEDAVVGNFEGLENGDKVYGDYTYQINYDAGDGNDVVLLVTGNPGAPDTGVVSVLTSPLGTALSALAVLGVIVAIRRSELKSAK